MKTGSEIAYFRRRMRTSLVMAAAAAGPCAEIAHQTLARLYGEAIESLSARMQSQPLLLEGPMIGLLHQENLRHAKITDDGRPTMALA
jgi:hypothetical protein